MDAYRFPKLLNLVVNDFRIAVVGDVLFGGGVHADLEAIFLDDDLVRVSADQISL